MVSTKVGIRTLRRRVIIKENEFPTLRRDCLRINEGIGQLYDRVFFEPININDLEKRYLIDILNGKAYKDTDVEKRSIERPYRYIRYFENCLYDRKYLAYKIHIDEIGDMYIQYRSNTPKIRIGWATAEKDFSKNEN